MGEEMKCDFCGFFEDPDIIERTHGKTMCFACEDNHCFCDNCNQIVDLVRKTEIRTDIERYVNYAFPDGKIETLKLACYQTPTGYDHCFEGYSKKWDYDHCFEGYSKKWEHEQTIKYPYDLPPHCPLCGKEDLQTINESILDEKERQVTNG